MRDRELTVVNLLENASVSHTAWTLLFLACFYLIVLLSLSPLLCYFHGQVVIGKESFKLNKAVEFTAYKDRSELAVHTCRPPG